MLFLSLEKSEVKQKTKNKKINQLAFSYHTRVDQTPVNDQVGQISDQISLASENKFLITMWLTALKQSSYVCEKNRHLHIFHHFYTTFWPFVSELTQTDTNH